MRVGIMLDVSGLLDAEICSYILCIADLGCKRGLHHNCISIAHSYSMKGLWTQVFSVL